jgi:hypothetical protein
VLTLCGRFSCDDVSDPPDGCPASFAPHSSDRENLALTREGHSIACVLSPLPTDLGGGFCFSQPEPFDLPKTYRCSDIFLGSVMSDEQARMANLAFSLAQIAAEQHKLSLEMAAIREMRRELAVKRSALVLKMLRTTPFKTPEVSCAPISRRPMQLHRVAGPRSASSFAKADQPFIRTANGGIILPHANVASALLRTERPVKSKRKVPGYESNTVTQDAPRRSFTKMVQ